MCPTLVARESWKIFKDRQGRVSYVGQYRLCPPRGTSWKTPTVSINISVIYSPRPGSSISRTGPHPGITITHDFTTSVNGTYYYPTHCWAEMLLLLCTYHPSPFFIWNFQHHHCAMAMRGKVSMSIHGLTKRYTVNTDENRIVACIRVMMLGLFSVQLAIVAVCVQLICGCCSPVLLAAEGRFRGCGICERYVALLSILFCVHWLQATHFHTI